MRRMVEGARRRRLGIVRVDDKKAREARVSATSSGSRRAAGKVGAADGDMAAPERAGVDYGPLDRRIGYLLRRAQMAVFRDFFAAFEAHDIRPGQYSILTVIECNPGRKQGEVSAALGIKRANFVAMIDLLERRKLVRRDPTPGDRRSYALMLTEKGKQPDDRAARPLRAPRADDHRRDRPRNLPQPRRAAKGDRAALGRGGRKLKAWEVEVRDCAAHAERPNSTYCGLSGWGGGNATGSGASFAGGIGSRRSLSRVGKGIAPKYERQPTEINSTER